MAPVFRKLTKRIFVIVNILSVAVFLLACANAVLHPEKWWFVAILGLAFPILLVIVVAFFVFWLLFRSRWAFLSLAALILGFTNIRALIGLHFKKDFNLSKEQGAIRILTWNVTSFDGQTKAIRTARSYRKEMLQFIQKEQPDILCFQEYMEPYVTKGYYNNMKDLSGLGYPYHFIAMDYGRTNGTFQVGIALFSRFPIVDTFHIRFRGPKNFRAAESLIAANLQVGNKIVRVYTTHLQSILFQKKDYRNLEIIRNADDSIMEASKSLVKKLKQGYTFRGDQVDIVRHYLDQSVFPEIICGDFNDVPNSYTYFRIKGDRRDAFIEEGFGIGRTFYAISPTLRIDYIMPDKQFEVLQYKRYLLPYSDHYPVIADVKLRDSLP